MNTRLFDDEDVCRVPKKDWSFEMLFQICGMLVAHSILQSGPGFPCLSSSIYAYLVSGNPSYCFPTKSDIPLDLGTHSLISFINEVQDIPYHNTIFTLGILYRLRKQNRMKILDLLLINQKILLF